MRTFSGRRLSVVLTSLALLVAGCGGGGDSEDSASDDVIDDVATVGERSVQVTGAGKVRLGGTLLVPPAASGGQRVPAALIVPPLGEGNRNGLATPGASTTDAIGKDLAQSFGNAGIASYRYDRRGIGESKLEPDVRLSFDDLVADAKAGLDLLAQRKETAGADLAVVGYKDGGLVALRLAAIDPRVKRVVLISAPGKPLVEVQAAELAPRYGPESGEALRTVVGQLLTNHTLPPLAQLRSELRPLLPTDELAFLEQVYRLDPAAEAAKVTAQAMVVAPTGDPSDPTRLVQALRQAQRVTPAPNADSTLQIIGPAPGDDRADPMSPVHEHGVAPSQAPRDRDQAAIERISAWLLGQ